MLQFRIDPSTGKLSQVGEAVHSASLVTIAFSA